MQRRFNRRLLGWIAGVAAFLAIAVVAIHGLQARRNARSLLRQGELALAEQQYGKAATYFSHYLAYQPDDIEALVKYGLALDKLAVSPGDRLRAVLVLNDVLRRDPGRQEVRYRLIHALIAIHRFLDALQEIDKLLPHWPDKAELEHKRGWCLEASGNYETAAAAFAKAIELDPRSIASYVLLADILNDRLYQPAEAQAVMDALVKANGNSYEAFLVRARFRQKHGTLDQAEADIKQALKLAPRAPHVLMASAELAQAKDDFTQARQYLEQGLALHPQNPALYKALANLEIRAGKRADAITALRRGLARAPSQPDLLLLLTDLLIDENQLDEAARNLQDFKHAAIAPVVIDFFQARLEIAGGRWAKAAALLERVREELGSGSEWVGRANALLGLCYEQLGDVELQLAAYRRAVSHDGHWTLARLGLAGALLANGRVDEAQTELKQVAKAADAPPETWIALARTTLILNLRKPEPQRRWDDVVEAVDKAAQANPKSSEVPILRADLLAAQKNYAAARELLDKALAKDAGQVSLWCALAELARIEQRPEEALKVLDQAQDRLGDRLELRLARARVWAGQPASQALQELDRLGQNLDGFSPEAQTRLRRELAEWRLRLGDVAGARQLWQLIAQDNPRDLRSRFLLLESFVHAGKKSEAAPLVAELRRLEGAEGYLWRYGQASLLVLNGRAEPKHLLEARRLLDEIGRLKPKWGRSHLLAARIDEIQGKHFLALDELLKAFELGERQPSMVSRLVRLLAERRRFLEAEQVLEKLEEAGPLTGDLAKMGADIALANQNAGRALRLAKLAVSAESRDYRDLVWLGKIHEGVGNHAQAEKLLRLAVDRAPHSPDTWVALVQLLHHEGKSADAVLTRAAHKVPADRLDWTLALCHDALGQPEQAEALFQKALAQRPDDFILLGALAEFYRRQEQPARAMPLLKKMLDPDSAAPSAFRAQARRSLALLLAATGDAAALQQAFALLEQNKVLHGSAAVDARVQALVRAFVPAQRSQALQAFEALLKNQPATPEELLVEARLYQADGDHARAREIILDLLATDGGRPEYLAFLTRSFIHTVDLIDARVYLTRLEKLEPNTSRTRTLQEELRKAENAG